MKSVRVEQQDLVIRVVLSRPDVRNAFDGETIADLTDVFRKIADGRIGTGARVVQLVGEGGSFCAGADLNYMKSMAGFSREENALDAERLFAMFETVRSCPLPVIAHVHGHAMGGGVGLTACADIALAESGTKFAFSEVRLGIIPAVISPFVLSRMNPGWARRWMMTGEVFDADQAFAAGLVSFVGTSDQVVAEKARLVKVFCEVGPEAVRETKMLIRDVVGRDPLDVQERVTEAIADRRVSAEGQEGLRAFLEKRDPSFRRGVKV
ncbi:MAG: enoyl-CoA hydratase/isomerase family protein [Bdellovibrionaceae bacterium]|nr:enoyl-CoA hydratase/isomerase family protein [Pseudobdellovibrionaceae bacterium]